MKWQDIIVTPLFWIVSIIGTVVLSIVGNLLTPWVSALVTRNLHARKSGLRKKQIQRRDKIVALQENVSRRTGVKLDGIFKVLLATLLQLLALFFFLLGFGGFHIMEAVKPSPVIQFPSILLILLAILASIVVVKLGMDDMTLALTADRREQAVDDFLKQHDPVSTLELKRVEDEWDLREFGVNSEHVNLPAISERERF
jgi:hypothetical protein